MIPPTVVEVIRWHDAIAQAPRDFLYVTLSFPVGLLWLIVLATAFMIGVSTSIVMIGIPILAMTLLLWRWGANAERERVALLLRAPIPRPPRRALEGGLLSRWRLQASERATWKELGYMVLLGTAGVLAGAIVIGLWSTVLAALAAPALVSIAPAHSLLADLTTGELFGVVAGGIALAALTVVLTRGLAVVCAAVATGLLAADERTILDARVEALEATRMRAVESADARLARLERDLHDGAQHRLAYIAMELGRARARIAEDPAAAAEQIHRAHEESKRAMTELRDLVRGIHPSVLTDRGLDAAVSGLAERCPVPVDVTVMLDARPPTALETAAYYVVAEALTNVAKHADADHASVELRRDERLLVVQVSDDGRGGATRRPGSGLEGLAQRVEALDGTLTIDSPPGGPTAIRTELPCAS